MLLISVTEGFHEDEIFDVHKRFAHNVTTNGSLEIIIIYLKAFLAAREGPVFLPVCGEARQVPGLPGGLAGGQGDLPRDLPGQPQQRGCGGGPAVLQRGAEKF